MSTLIDHPKAPECGCCDGDGTHFVRVAASASPDDYDEPCVNCNGTGHSWFEARPNSCSAARRVRRAGG
jgi:DnaJ-class molecular chaperone